MKIRYDYVTNSSSVSYLIAVKEDELTVSQSMIFKNIMRLVDEEDCSIGKKLDANEDVLKYYKENMTDKEKFESENFDDTWNYYIKDIDYQSSEMCDIFDSFDKDKLKKFVLYN